MAKIIDLEGYIIDGGGTFLGTPEADGAGWGSVSEPVVIYLLGGNDRVGGGGGYSFGTEPTITIFCGEGNDTVQGIGTVNTFYGGKGDDLLGGNEKNDILYGNLENDRLLGGFGNDTLFGGQGADYCSGSYGDDLIVGGRGENTVYGDEITSVGTSGGGKDIFVIENFGESGNFVNIMDFIDGEDKIGLAKGLSFEKLSIVDTGINLVISLQNSNEPLAILTKTVAQRPPLTVSSFTKDDFLSLP